MRLAAWLIAALAAAYLIGGTVALLVYAGRGVPAHIEGVR